MNTQLLEEVRQHILKDPKSFNMFTYYEKITDPEENKCYGVNYCGTVGCICGHTVHIVKKRRKKSCKSLGLNNDFSEGYGDDEGVSKNLLKISILEGHHLFHEDRWPLEYYEDYKDSKTPRGRASVASRLLKEVIKRGKVWWSVDQGGDCKCPRCYQYRQDHPSSKTLSFSPVLSF